jgi:hypothetical protein
MESPSLQQIHHFSFLFSFGRDPPPHSAGYRHTHNLHAIGRVDCVAISGANVICVVSISRYLIIFSVCVWMCVSFIGWKLVKFLSKKGKKKKKRI